MTDARHPGLTALPGSAATLRPAINPTQSPTLDALAEYLTDRPALQYVLEAELNRLWGGRPVFETSPSQPDPPSGKSAA